MLEKLSGQYFTVGHCILKKKALTKATKIHRMTNKCCAGRDGSFKMCFAGNRSYTVDVFHGRQMCVGDLLGCIDDSLQGTSSDHPFSTRIPCVTTLDRTAVKGLQLLLWQVDQKVCATTGDALYYISSCTVGDDQPASL